MALKVEDLGELAYGGLVTGAEWWDNDRIAKNTLAKKDIFKKAGFYAYLVPGGVATLVSAMGWWREGEAWTERLSHGFLYDLPRFVSGIVKSMSTTTSREVSSAAVMEAQRILSTRRNAAISGADGRLVNDSAKEQFQDVREY